MQPLQSKYSPVLKTIQAFLIAIFTSRAHYYQQQTSRKS